MNPKKQSELAHKLVCLKILLVENLDELNASSELMMQYKCLLTQIGEQLINQVADTETVLKTTYFNDISNKIDTVIRKSFNPNM